MTRLIFGALLLFLVGALAGVPEGAGAAPALQGNYVSAAGLPHPFVFAKPDQYRALLTRHTQITDKALARLQGLVTDELRRGSEYTQAYSGCELNVYLHKLTHEQSGAAKAANDLALYAYLSSLHLGYGQPAVATQAAALANSILLDWARDGFRENGRFRSQLGQYCEDGRVSLASRLDVALEIGRGMPYWVSAEDLLSAANAMPAPQRAALDGFLDAVYGLVLAGSNFWTEHAYNDCERYSNHASVHILALLAIARFRDNAAEFVDTASAGRQLRVPWTMQVEQNIYGRNDQPRACQSNNVAPTKSFQMPQVAPGEIVDRYRAGPLQTLGYPLASLRALLLSAEIMRNAGFNPLAFVGPKGQSLPLALNYYGYYFTTFLNSGATAVSARGGHPYAGERQYMGHPVSGAAGVTIEGKDLNLEPFLIGYHLDPSDYGARAVVTRAMSFSAQLTPFYGVDPLAYNCLVDLPGTKQ
jgi:hypothetical protein